MADTVMITKPFCGEKISFTGRLAALTQSEAVDLVHKYGGTWSKSVTPNTTLLVVGQDGWPLRKDGQLTQNLKKARFLQERIPITILTENDFLNRLGTEAATCHLRLTIAQVSDILQIPGERIRAWVRLGLVKPVDTMDCVHYFDFRQVRWAKSLLEFMKAGVKTERIRRSLEKLRKWLPGVEDPLNQLAVVEKDSQLFVRLESGQLADPTGQGLLDFEEDCEAQCVPAMPGPKTADDWFKLGYRKEEKKNLEEAAAAYRQALLLGGPDAQTDFNLGNILYKLGQKEQAVERYYQAVELDPGLTEAWNNLGNVLVELGHPTEAVNVFQRALEINPFYVDTHYNLADTLDQLGLQQQAISHWKTYVRHDSLSRWGKYAQLRLGELEKRKI